MSLKESWLTDRQHRQQEAVQRQQAVQQILSDFNQTRQINAAHLHQQLMLFREGLTQQDYQRRIDFQVVQAELQQFCELLQQETAELLGMMTADRALMAQQLATELQAFHQELRACVRSLRQATQADLAILKADTQAYLADCQIQRSQINAETRQSLLQWLENLRVDVQSHLVYLAELRQHRATQLQQDLHHSRVTRAAEVQELLAHLSEFRADLQSFRHSIHQAVWGQSTPTAPKLPQKESVQKISAIPPITAIAPQPVATKPTPGRSAPAKTTPPGKTIPPKTQAKALTKPAAKKVSAPKVAVSRSTPQTSQKSLDSAPQAAIQDEVPFEKDVYIFLHENHGARLTQIEAGLKVNRFQAVDALRSLIKKGLVTQRDRVYLTQEPS